MAKAYPGAVFGGVVCNVDVAVQPGGDAQTLMPLGRIGIDLPRCWRGCFRR